MIIRKLFSGVVLITLFCSCFTGELMAQASAVHKNLRAYISTGNDMYAEQVRTLAPDSEYAMAIDAWGQRGNNNQGALATAKVLVDQFPEMAEGHFILGVIRMEIQGKSDEAIQLFDKSIELSDDFTTAYLYRGKARMLTEDYEAAIRDFDLVLSRERSNATATLLKGVCQFQAGDESGLVAAFDIAVQMDPMVISDNYLPDVIEATERAFELSPENVNLYHARGIAYFNQGEFKDCSADFEKAIDLVPGNAEYYKYSGACKYFLEDAEAARDDLNMSLGINADDPDTYYYLGMLANYLDGLPRRGYEYFTTAIELDPSRADYYYQRAKSSFDLTNYEQSLEDVDKAIEMFDKNGNYYALRGMCNLRLDKKDSVICLDFEKAYALGTFWKIRKFYRRTCD